VLQQALMACRWPSESHTEVVGALETVWVEPYRHWHGTISPMPPSLFDARGSGVRRRRVRADGSERRRISSGFVGRDRVSHLRVSRVTTFEGRRMSRSRDRIMSNLDEMYREGFERAKADDDQAQMVALDVAYRREQLYFEVLLDLRDATERRSINN
jgi:hypothetical protein